jgi:hypothetical protein
MGSFPCRLGPNLALTPFRARSDYSYSYGDHSSDCGDLDDEVCAITDCDGACFTECICRVRTSPPTP